MTTQTKTETPDNGQSELERLAKVIAATVYSNSQTFLSEHTRFVIEQESLKALTIATAPLKEEIRKLQDDNQFLLGAVESEQRMRVEKNITITAAHAKIRELEAMLHGKCEGQSKP